MRTIFMLARIEQLWFLVLIFLFLEGCSVFGYKVKVEQTKCEKPVPCTLVEPEITGIDAIFTTTSQLNPSVKGHPLPLTVYLYQLKSPTIFGKTDYFTLEEQDKTILGSEMIGKRDELKLKPNEAYHYAHELDTETRYLGIVAAYRDIEHATWQTVVNLAPNIITSVVIRLDSKAMTVQKLEKQEFPIKEISPEQILLETQDKVKQGTDLYKKGQQLLKFK